jgi:hypothetical protein
MRRIVMVILLLFLLPTRPAEALTVNDIINLTRAGLSDEVLVALIEVDGSMFAIDTATLTKLKEAGVSERVIVAMVRSGRTKPVEEVQPTGVSPPEPPPVVPVERESQPPPLVVAVPISVYVPVAVRSRGHGVRTPDHTLLDSRTQRMPELLTDRPARSSRGEPEYWGWGGKLRPDAWKPKQ